MRRRFSALIALLVIACLVAGGIVLVPKRAAPPTVGVPNTVEFGSYANTDWPAPEASYMANLGGVSGDCTSFWNWTRACYTSTAGTGGITMHQKLVNDTNFITTNHLGTFQRFWVSLDQMFSQSLTTTFTGSEFSSTSLTNFDDAMSVFANAGMSLDLVLLTSSHGTTGLQLNSLDGNHDTAMNDYVQAVSDFMAHIAGNATDSKVVKVADLCNECYGQFDSYFTCGTGANCGSPFPNLGIWQNNDGNLAACIPTTLSTANINASPCSRANAEANLSGGVTTAGHGCENSGLTAVVTVCVEINIIYPWILSLSNAAHAADPNVLYTVSTECCTASPLIAPAGSGYTQAGFYQQEYPVDIYDQHLYSGCGTGSYTCNSCPPTQTYYTCSTPPCPCTITPAFADGPWSPLWVSYMQNIKSNAATAGKRWFVGEAGCGNNDNACTYAGNDVHAAEVDQWWLSTVWQYGGQAVDIEQGAGATGWLNPSAGSYSITAVGRAIADANGGGAHFRPHR